jgi:hypothetical protein
MRELFSTGMVADIVLGFMALEVVILRAWRRHGHRRISFARLLIPALPGVFLVLALRGALTDASWSWIAAWLCAALLAHLVDLHERHFSAPEPP